MSPSATWDRAAGDHPCAELDVREPLSSSAERVAKDDDLLPKKKPSAAKSPIKGASSGISPRMIRVTRMSRTVGILLGGFVTLIGMMSLVGFITDNFWVRLALALLVVAGFPAFVSDRFLKRTNLGGGLGMVADIFAIVLLGVALVLVAADVVSRPLLVREGDRYAKSGSRAMARVVYFLGGVSPVFPEEKSPASAGSGSAVGSAASSSAPPPPIPAPTTSAIRKN